MPQPPSIRIGNVEIIAVADAAANVPCAALFPGRTDEEWAPHREHLCEDPAQMPLSISSFVVRSAGRTILVDTGIGAKDRPLFPNGRLPEALRESGIAIDTIDTVLATHMHIDHVGWHTTQRGEAFVPTFPNASHVFNRAEWEYFTAPEVANANGNAHILDSVLPLKDVAKIELVDEEHSVTDDITLVPTPGHTPAHVSVAIVSNGEAGVIIGDVCHHPAQIAEGWASLFDMNPALAQQSREKLLQRIEDERMRVIAGHFAHPGFGRVVRVEGKRSWRAG